MGTGGGLRSQCFIQFLKQSSSFGVNNTHTFGDDSTKWKCQAEASVSSESMETCLDPSHSPRPGWFLFCKVAAWLTSKLPSLLLFSYKHLLSNSCVPGTVMGTGHGELSKIRHLLEEKAGQEDRCPHQCLLSLWLPPSVFFCPYLHCLCAWLTCSSYSY